LPVRSGGGDARQAMAAPIALGDAAAIAGRVSARPTPGKAKLERGGLAVK
jgi:hypothetical protein